MENRVGIIGAGLIGRAWAILFARAGWQVQITDNNPKVADDLAQLLAKDCAILVDHGLCKNHQEVLARINWCDSIEDAVKDARFVQENSPEILTLKQEIFAEMDRHAARETVLASSTSGIVASLFSANLPGRERCLVGHPVNPPHLVPLVEICGASWTSDAAIKRAHAIYEEIGQVPVLVKKEVTGFVLNRLQGALLAEAFRLVRDGVISVADLDKTVKDGLGLRWSVLGPFETIDLNAPGGIADYCDRYLDIYRSLTDDPPPSSVFDQTTRDAIIAAFGKSPDKDRLESETAARNAGLAGLRAYQNSIG